MHLDVRRPRRADDPDWLQALPAGTYNAFFTFHGYFSYAREEDSTLAYQDLPREALMLMQSALYDRSDLAEHDDSTFRKWFAREVLSRGVEAGLNWTVASCTPTAQAAFYLLVSLAPIVRANPDLASRAKAEMITAAETLLGLVERGELIPIAQAR